MLRRTGCPWDRGPRLVCVAGLSVQTIARARLLYSGMAALALPPDNGRPLLRARPLAAELSHFFFRFVRTGELGVEVES